jgi:chloride channel 7
MENGNLAGLFFAFHFFCLFFMMITAWFCWREPYAAGSGIPEIKAFLNGVDIKGIVRFPVLVHKVFAMCFAVAGGLPLGKEGPMIHSGSIIGALVSQGNTISVGYDTSWNLFQDLRNDYTKRDYVTYGAAAGVAAAFRAPIGGILFTLEEGASFWSTNTTFRSFMCAVVTQLTIGIIFPEDATSSVGMFAFGQFDNLFDGRSNFYVYELPLFIAIGCLGGLFGAFFNFVNLRAGQYRAKNINISKQKRVIELLSVTLLMSFISFMLPLMWQVCTPRPEPQGYNTKQEINLLEDLVSFQCSSGSYNQLASLYFTPSDTAMRQLFHFREVNGEGFDSFTSGPLILFFIPYFLIFCLTPGMMTPAGLFVPGFLSGAAYGRLIGHWVNLAFPGHVADSGTYALIGAAALLGGMARMTIAGCVIMLEASGNITYLLPLMVTFAGARYVGNAINEPFYDILIHLKNMPFLEGSLHSLGMLNYHPISEIMAKPVIVLQEIEKVGRVMEVLNTSSHYGFPIVNKEGKLRGLILRKTLCTLLKMKAYSTPADAPKQADGGILLVQAATVFYDAIERVYPNYPSVANIKLADRELVLM